MARDKNEKVEPAEQLKRASEWWTTKIVDIKPGSIRMRGYAIEELIGRISFPQMIWLMLRGELPTAEQSSLLEAALVSAVDHGPHAPSISISRMAVTCGLPLNGAMASAINVLDDIHGGAGEQCMALYAQISQRLDRGEPIVSATEAVLEAFRAEFGKIIPGFGHRFHPTDPRSVRLLALVEDARKSGFVDGRFADVGRSVESVLERQKGKKLPMNIDGATAVIYSELGFPPPLGRGLFISRALLESLRMRGNSPSKAGVLRDQCRRVFHTTTPENPSGILRFEKQPISE